MSTAVRARGTARVNRILSAHDGTHAHAADRVTATDTGETLPMPW